MQLTHTKQGGQLDDVGLGTARDAYGWNACHQVLNLNNADSVVLLAIALKVWSAGFTVTNEGAVVDRTSPSPKPAPTP